MLCTCTISYRPHLFSLLSLYFGFSIINDQVFLTRDLIRNEHYKAPIYRSISRSVVEQWNQIIRIKKFRIRDVVETEILVDFI